MENTKRFQTVSLSLVAFVVVLLVAWLALSQGSSSDPAEIPNALQLVSDHSNGDFTFPQIDFDYHEDFVGRGYETQEEAAAAFAEDLHVDPGAITDALANADADEAYDETVEAIGRTFVDENQCGMACQTELARQIKAENPYLGQVVEYLYDLPTEAELEPVPEAGD